MPKNDSSRHLIHRYLLSHHPSRAPAPASRDIPGLARSSSGPLSNLELTIFPCLRAVVVASHSREWQVGAMVACDALQKSPENAASWKNNRRSWSVAAWSDAPGTSQEGILAFSRLPWNGRHRILIAYGITFARRRQPIYLYEVKQFAPQDS
jgi:hypothetical protein